MTVTVSPAEALICQSSVFAKSWAITAVSSASISDFSSGGGGGAAAGAARARLGVWTTKTGGFRAVFVQTPPPSASAS
eukprot:CAMPEP_0171888574 /NCGR_PEP_ID=MMETSP0992-20121227/43089_1 /TAXON_ID=483369 /ORGANISM="non described non described, Strain CCMP2098" /LENGTH=77 /DNA_ID=CAMNT_0012515473 /DNA_START=210 /DNA_END=440 /DNA_ORIENTATION=-